MIDLDAIETRCKNSKDFFDSNQTSMLMMHTNSVLELVAMARMTKTASLEAVKEVIRAEKAEAELKDARKEYASLLTEKLDALQVEPAVASALHIAGERHRDWKACLNGYNKLEVICDQLAAALRDYYCERDCCKDRTEPFIAKTANALFAYDEARKVRA